MRTSAWPVGAVVRLFRMIIVPQLRAGWGRALVVVAGVATGVALLVAVNTCTSTAIESTRHALAATAGPADLEVRLGLGEVGFPEAVAEVVRRDPDVAAAVALVRGWIAPADDPTDALQLFGADLTAEDDLARYQLATRTSRSEILRTLADPHAVFLTGTMAAARGLDVGSEVAFSTARGVQRLTVRGLLENGGVAAALAGKIAVMDLPAAQLLLARPGLVDQVDVVLREGADRATVERRLAAALPPTLTVGVPAARGVQYATVLGSARLLLRTVSALCLIAASYIVYSTTATGAAERAIEMAALRLIGADGPMLARLLLVEAALLGFVGALSGVAYGLGIAYFLADMVATGFGTMWQLRFPANGLAIDPREHAVYALVGVIVAVVASWPAARRLAHLEPVTVLRLRGLPPERPPRTARWLGLGLAATVLAALAIVIEIRLRSAGWGNVALALWHGSLFLFAIPFVQGSAGVLATLLPRWWGVAGATAVHGIARAPIRTGLAVAAIVLTLSLSMMIATLTNSGSRTVADYLETAMAGDLAVSGVTTDGGFLESPIVETLADEIAAVPGVAGVETLRVVPGQWYGGERIALTMFSDGLVARVPTYWYVQGDPVRAAPALRAGDAVAISTSLAQRMDLRVGMPIRLDTPTGVLERPIVGVFRDFMSERGSVIMSRSLYRRHWNDATVNRIFVSVAPSATLEQVRSGIRARLDGAYVLQILSTRESVTAITATIDRAFAFTDSIQLLVAIVTAVGIFDLLFSAILARRRELALWRLIGAADHVVRRAVGIESGVIGVLGIALGAVCGTLASYFWITFVYQYIIGYVFDFYLDYVAAAGSIALVLVTTLLAGVLAARFATRKPVLEGIRSD